MAQANGWPALFSSAFQQSRNAMMLVSEHRRIVDANAACLQLLGRRADELRQRPVWKLVVDGPLSTEREWREQIATRRFSGEAQLRHADGSRVLIQWGATTEVVTRRRLVLFVALGATGPEIADELREGPQHRRSRPMNERSGSCAAGSPIPVRRS